MSRVQCGMGAVSTLASLAAAWADERCTAAAALLVNQQQAAAPRDHWTAVAPATCENPKPLNSLNIGATRRSTSSLVPSVLAMPPACTGSTCCMWMASNPNCQHCQLQYRMQEASMPGPSRPASTHMHPSGNSIRWCVPAHQAMQTLGKIAAAPTAARHSLAATARSQ